jgi:predicted transcriptional regulator
MCAGSSSRFKGQDKFLIPFKFDKITLLDIVFQRLKKNVGSNKKMPIIINCNQSNIQIIQDYIKKNLHYGFDPQKIRYVLTSALAVFDQRGNYCLTPKLRLIRRPSGTASCAEELLNSSAYSFLKEEGV